MTPENTVSYNLDGRVATIRIDDGKRNALPPQVIKEIYAAIDRAEADRAAIVITGRAGVLSAGFDLNVMKRGGIEALKMLSLGYGLPARILAYPHPVVIACNGHCFAMGVFMMLSADYVIGSRGEFRVSANEVAIGLTMPREQSRCRRHFHRRPHSTRASSTRSSRPTHFIQARRNARNGSSVWTIGRIGFPSAESASDLSGNYASIDPWTCGMR